MANDNPPISGIPGLTGRRSVSCALTVGKKGANGAPTEKDRFHLLTGDADDAEFSKRDGGTYKAPMRKGHPDYEAFNAASAQYRKSIPAVLYHLRVEQAWEHRYNCGSGPVAVERGIPAHPKKAAVCKGDGVNADRWNGREYVRIPCPGDACPLRLPGPNFQGRPSKPPCGPWMRFIARTAWHRDGKQLRDNTFKYTSGGWNSAAEFKGFFEEFNGICTGFGVDPRDVPLFGMPVRLTLSERTNVEAKSRFPVVTIAIDGELDMVAWIGHQLQTRETIKRMAMAAPVPALTDSHQQREEILNADYSVIEGPSIAQPGQG